MHMNTNTLDIKLHFISKFDIFAVSGTEPILYEYVNEDDCHCSSVKTQIFHVKLPITFKWRSRSIQLPLEN